METGYKNHTLGTNAFVLSIIGFMTGLMGIGIFLDILAIILAVITLKKSKSISIKTTLPKASIIISATSLVLMLLMFVSGVNQNGIISKEQMLGEIQATGIASIEYEVEKDGNINISKKKYDNKIIATNGIVVDIEEDYASCACTFDYIVFSAKALISDTIVYFADEAALLQLRKGENVNLLGKITVSGDHSFILENAYLLTDEEYEQIMNKKQD